LAYKSIPYFYGLALTFQVTTFCGRPGDDRTSSIKCSLRRQPVVFTAFSKKYRVHGIASNKLHFPGALAAAGNSLWVAEFKFSSRILRYQYSAPATIDGRQEEIRGFALHQNYPNPFNAITVIGYQLPQAGHVTLRIFDVLGREVALLVDEFKHPGTYQSPYSTVNSPISSGVYFYRLQSGNSSLVRKMIACN